MDPNTGEPLQELTQVCRNWLRENGSEAETVAEAIEEIKKHPNGSLSRAVQKGIERLVLIHLVYFNFFECINCPSKNTLV